MHLSLSGVPPSRFFLDESGHGGDLSSSGDLGFAGQPVFALACVGVADEQGLEEELARMKIRHRCGDGEIKSSALGSRLPMFASELTGWLLERDAAVFVEVVEKRYFVAIHAVNHLLCAFRGLDGVGQTVRSTIAELVVGTDYEAVLLGYLGACRSRSLDDVASVLDGLWWTADRSDEDIARVVQVLAMLARDRTREAGAVAEDFLPIADEGPTGRAVWMLPNLTSLTNLYGRVNQSRRSLVGVTLVHDVQLQYGGVLDAAKAQLEDLSACGAMPFTPFADYGLRGRAELTFATAIDEPCLQAADVIAGCAMRFGRGAFRRGGAAGSPLRDAFTAIFDAGDPFRATGVNLVMSDKGLTRLRLHHVAAAPFVRGARVDG